MTHEENTPGAAAVPLAELPPASPEALAAWERAFGVVHEIRARYAAEISVEAEDPPRAEGER